MRVAPVLPDKVNRTHRREPTYTLIKYTNVYIVVMDITKLEASKLLKLILVYLFYERICYGSSHIF